MKISEVIREFEGEDPRIVAELGNFDYEIIHTREDVEGRYSEEDLEEAYQLIMSNQITGDDFKRLIGRGQYEAQTLFFGDIVVFLFPSERYEAVFASFDYGDDFPVTDLIRRAADTRDSGRDA